MRKDEVCLNSPEAFTEEPRSRARLLGQAVLEEESCAGVAVSACSPHRCSAQWILLCLTASPTPCNLLPYFLSVCRPGDLALALSLAAAPGGVTWLLSLKQGGKRQFLCLLKERKKKGMRGRIPLPDMRDNKTRLEDKLPQSSSLVVNTE